MSLNVFNAALMNDAVYKFKCYEDSSLTYTGIEAGELKGIGLYDTVILPPKQVQPKATPTKEPPVVTPIQEPKPQTFVEKHVGDEVTHKSFGVGTILSIDEKFITCRFKGNREKKFYYPQILEQGYMK